MCAKRILQITQFRMDLETQILPTYSIKEVKANREFFPKQTKNTFTKNRFPRKEHQIIPWRFKLRFAKVKQHTIFFRYPVKTPRKIDFIFTKIKCFLHPVTTPKAWIKEWYQ